MPSISGKIYYLHNCGRCGSETKFVETVESNDSVTHNGIDGKEMHFCRYQERAALHECVQCGQRWRYYATMQAYVDVEPFSPNRKDRW